MKLSGKKDKFVEESISRFEALRNKKADFKSKITVIKNSIDFYSTELRSISSISDNITNIVSGKSVFETPFKDRFQSKIEELEEALQVLENNYSNFLETTNYEVEKKQYKLLMTGRKTSQVLGESFVPA